MRCCINTVFCGHLQTTDTLLHCHHCDMLNRSLACLAMVMACTSGKVDRVQYVCASCLTALSACWVAKAIHSETVVLHL